MSLPREGGLTSHNHHATMNSGALVVDSPTLNATVTGTSLDALQPYLDDPEVEELWINAPGRVFVLRRGRSELTTTVITDADIRDAVERMLEPSGRRVDLSTPFVDAMLPSGARLHVVIPDIVRAHWAINIRKFVAPASQLQDLVNLGTMPQQAADFLEAAVIAGLNIIVSGATGAGKTTLLQCLLHAVPARERIVTVEEVFELSLDAPDWVAMQTRPASLEGTGEVRLRALVKEALRMRPDRLVVGEVRQEEALDLLLALNSGHPGMCSIHASSAREAIQKLTTLPLLAGPNVSSAFVIPTVATSVDLVIHVGTDVDGKRRVREIVSLSGRVEGDVIEASDVFVTGTHGLIRGTGIPLRVDRFERSGIDIQRILRAA